MASTTTATVRSTTPTQGAVSRRQVRHRRCSHYLGSSNAVSPAGNSNISPPASSTTGNDAHCASGGPGPKLLAVEGAPTPNERRAERWSPQADRPRRPGRAAPGYPQICADGMPANCRRLPTCRGAACPGVRRPDVPKGSAANPFAFQPLAPSPHGGRSGSRRFCGVSDPMRKRAGRARSRAALCE